LSAKYYALIAEAMEQSTLKIFLYAQLAMEKDKHSVVNLLEMAISGSIRKSILYDRVFSLPWDWEYH